MLLSLGASQNASVKDSLLSKRVSERSTLLRLAQALMKLLASVTLEKSTPDRFTLLSELQCSRVCCREVTWERSSERKSTDLRFTHKLNIA